MLVVDKKVTLKIVVIGEPETYRESLCKAYAGMDKAGEIAGATVYYKVDEFVVNSENISVWWIIYDLKPKGELMNIVEIYLRYMDGAIVISDLEDDESPKKVADTVREFWGIVGIKPLIIVGVFSDYSRVDSETTKLIRAYAEKTSKIIGTKIAFVEISSSFDYEEVRKIFVTFFDVLYESLKKEG